MQHHDGSLNNLMLLTTNSVYPLNSVSGTVQLKSNNFYIFYFGSLLSLNHYKRISALRETLFIIYVCDHTPVSWLCVVMCRIQLETFDFLLKCFLTL